MLDSGSIIWVNYVRPFLLDSWWGLLSCEEHLFDAVIVRIVICLTFSHTDCKVLEVFLYYRQLKNANCTLFDTSCACYSWCNQVLWSPQMVRKIPPGGGTSNRRWDLWSEMGTSNQRWHLQLDMTPLSRGRASNWRWDLQLEVSPPIRGGTSNQRGLMHVGPHRSTLCYM